MFDSEEGYDPGASSDVFDIANTALAWAEDELVSQFDNHQLKLSYEQLRKLGDLFHAQARRRLAVVDDRQSYASDGYPSTTAYPTHRFRTTGGTAKWQVTEVRALQGMPQTRHLAEQGRLSSDQVRTLIAAKQAAPDRFAADEPELCGIAETLEWVADLRKATGYWQQAAAPEPTYPTLDDQQDASYLYVSRTFENMVKLDGLYDRQRGALLIEAIKAAIPAPIEGQPSTPSQRRAMALFDLIVSDGQKPATPTMLVHVNAETLTGDYLTLAELGRDVLEKYTIDRLACDAQFRRIVLGPKSEIIDVGRSLRLVTKPMRDALIARDRHCAFPGCDRDPQWCDCHHITPWWQGDQPQPTTCSCSAATTTHSSTPANSRYAAPATNQRSTERTANPSAASTSSTPDKHAELTKRKPVTDTNAETARSLKLPDPG